MAAWKIAPGSPAATQLSTEPAETIPPRSCSPKIAEEVGLPPGVVNIVTGDGVLAGDRRTPRRRQDRFHRQHRSRQDHHEIRRQPTPRRQVQTPHARARRQSPHIIFEDAARSIRPVEGIISGIYFNQVKSAAPGSRSSAGIGPPIPSSKRDPLASLPHRRPDGQNTDVGRQQQGTALEHSTLKLRPDRGRPAPHARLQRGSLTRQHGQQARPAQQGLLVPPPASSHRRAARATRSPTKKLFGPSAQRALPSARPKKL